MILKENNMLTSEDIVIDHDPENPEQISFKDTKFILSPSLKKIRNGDDDLIYDEEAETYIELRWAQKTKNFAKEKADLSSVLLKSSKDETPPVAFTDPDNEDEDEEEDEEDMAEVH